MDVRTQLSPVSNMHANDCKTPPKKLFTFHGLLGQSHTNNYQTPPARITKLKNPFEQVLREHLGTNFISPTLFTKKTPVKKEFSWTIDELSMLQPAEIDENSSHQFESPEHDEVTQSRIDSYFSMQQILPSPMLPCEGVPLIKPDREVFSPTSTTTSSLPAHPVQITSSSAQTVLTLPPVLPEEVERVLKPYFSFTQDQQNVGYDVRQDSEFYKNYSMILNHHHMKKVMMNQQRSLVRRFEDFQSHDCTICIARCINARSALRGIMTRLIFVHCRQCTTAVRVKDETDKNETEKNSSQVMSIDGSFVVPDCSAVEKHNSSQLDSSHHSSDALGTSTMNWDIEYKDMFSPLAQSNAATEAMEMSRLNTPKQRPVLSQRKKLSDSFGNDAQVDEDDEDYMAMSQQSIKTDEHNESGYHSAPSFLQANQTNAPVTTSTINSTMAEATSLWASVDVVSSTPTKRKQCSL
ncbi:LOW QUALITY PROTEIN: uncharacterized protein bora [Atheta coriaria]|uniref:LOW QUALITY PROTEIN: uncharacterized protein bora n=1 Tax=Dalotia coriaria TaxID=877792 RepID=UPI0031F424EF